MGKIKSVLKRSGTIVPFTPERITNAIYRAAVAVGGRDRSIAEGLSQQVVNILEDRASIDTIPTIEEIQDVVEKVLIENGHAKVAKAYILYRDERNRHRQERAEQASWPSENIPWAKIWHILNWAVDHGVNTVQGLNERIARGEFPKIVTESEAVYNEDVENATEMIAQRKNALRLVVIAGPSSSGKTTTTMKVAQRLKRMGLRLITLNVDNYFYDLELHPKDEFGDYDFETPQALDLGLINADLTKLVEGEEVNIPKYDFKSGRRTEERIPLRLKPHDILLIDSLHGLYPEMTTDIPSGQKFKLYLEPLLQMKGPDGRFIRWTDIRMMRRMLRDASQRAYDPKQTLEHWHYVRSSEMRNIIPHINTTDYIINSAMPYELPIFRTRMLDSFAEWASFYAGNPLREDAHTRAARIYQLLESVTAVEDESPIPFDSVTREFIGGSSYAY
jgi:uridine kinase